ncbi:MAG: GntG family PLP-dependent aldolase [Planctomycetota bacterium]
MSDVVDLRSDTITRPTDAMRDAMARAEVGDDVLQDDPTVIRLEERVAEILGKEAALFVPSGTMANQLAIRFHCEPGDEIIVHGESHIVHYESGAPAALWGCSTAFAYGDRGFFTPDDVRDLIRYRDVHCARSRLVVMENTHNRGGGAVWPVDRFASVAARAKEEQLRVHLDGARLWNAGVAAGEPLTVWTQHADSVSVCFSKGLGAPVGSALASTRENIEKARRFRKMLGGGMRQVGIVAAGALHAVEHHRERLADDHANAKALAEGIADVPGVSIDPSSIETNILYFGVDLPGEREPAQRVCDALEASGVRMLSETRNRVRAVTNMHVDRAMIDRAAQAVRDAMATLTSR